MKSCLSESVFKTAPGGNNVQCIPMLKFHWNYEISPPKFANIAGKRFAQVFPFSQFEPSHTHTHTHTQCLWNDQTSSLTNCNENGVSWCQNGLSIVIFSLWWIYMFNICKYQARTRFAGCLEPKWNWSKPKYPSINISRIAQIWLDLCFQTRSFAQNVFI